MNTIVELNNKRYELDKATGELTELINVDIPVGSNVITPRQKAAYKDKLEREKQKSIAERKRKSLGTFYFVLAEHQFEELSPKTAARLIFLCTYLCYNGTLVFNLKTKQRIRKSDLPMLMGLSGATVFRFWQEVNPNYIVEEEEGLRIVHPSILRGNLRHNEYEPYQRFYINGVRSLYKMTDLTQHQHLGFIFKLLPYINFEYNVLCAHEYQGETELEKIKLLSAQELCNMIGYDYAHFNRLKKIYNDILFEINGHEEYFLTFVQHGEDEIQFFVNPKILYVGSDYEKVEVLGLFTVKRSKSA